MNRKDFLKGIGIVGASVVLPSEKIAAATSEMLPPPNACTIIPSETAGPFPLDLTANSYYFRKDIRETQKGVQLNVKFKIIGADNCLPMKNLRVNMWHCSKEGIYSGYSNNMNPGDANSKHLRGYQFTDANGIAEMITVFPGWYNGRIAHIHFQVHVSSSYAAVSQFSFDVAAKNALYAANPSLYPTGSDPMTFAKDNVFSDGYNLQLATLTPNPITGGYDSYFEVTIKGSGTTSIGHIEAQNAKQFSLAQNYPNPFEKATTIPFELINNSDVKIELFDLMGRNVATIMNENLASGKHECTVDLRSLGLPIANYAYQIEVKNSDGIFKDAKIMTSI